MNIIIISDKDEKNQCLMMTDKGNNDKNEKKMYIYI